MLKKNTFLKQLFLSAACLCTLSFTLYTNPEDLLIFTPEPNDALQSVADAFVETKSRVSLRLLKKGQQMFKSANVIALYHPNKQKLSLVLYDKNNEQFVIIVPSKTEAEKYDYEYISHPVFCGFLLRNPDVRGYALAPDKGMNIAALLCGLAFSAAASISFVGTFGSHSRATALTFFLVSLLCGGAAGTSYAFLKSSRSYANLDAAFVDARKTVWNQQDDVVRQGADQALQKKKVLLLESE